MSQRAPFPFALPYSASGGKAKARPLPIRLFFLAAVAGAAFFSPWHVYDLLTPGTVGVTPFTLCIYLAVLGCAGMILSGERVTFAPTDWLSIGLLVWAVASVLWTTADLTLVRSSLLFYGACVGLFCFIRVGITSPGEYRFLAWAMIAGSTGACVEVCIRFIHGQDLYGRFSTAELNANYVAYAQATAVLVAYSLVRLFPRRKANWLTLPFILLALFVIFLTKCRGALLALVLAGGWVLLRRLSTAMKICCLVGAAVVLFLLLYNDQALNIIYRFNDLMGRDSHETDSGRLLAWSLARRFLAEHPLVGIGVGAFEQANPSGTPVHNVFLGMATELGLTGFLLYFGTGLAGLWSNLQRHSRPLDRHLALLLIIGWLPIAMSGEWRLSPVAWLALGLFSRLSSCAPEAPLDRSRPA